MESYLKLMKNKICLISAEEQQERLRRIGLDGAALVSENFSIFYLTGRIFAGYILLMPGENPKYYVKRPLMDEGDDIKLIRKPEDIPALPKGTTLGLELGALSYNDALRLQKALGADSITDISPKLMGARSRKTPFEINMMKTDGEKQSAVYQRIPNMYRPGMTDIELQAAIEHELRLEGCLGVFRVNGSSMEIHMGNVLTGENSDTPSPYDFAMGGEGMNPALPVGANGEEIKPGRAVMVDMNGCFNGYMTDMTRMYSLGKLPEEAIRAHECSVEICHTLAKMGTPGTETKSLYEKAKEIAERYGLSAYFMGHNQQAGFVGHGVGIQVNELPVLAPRSKSVLADGNVIAIEPKFVIPGFGAIGIENTYVCRETGLECITLAPEEIIPLQ